MRYEHNIEERLLQEAPKGNLSQAYLITASTDIATETASETFIQRIFCKTHSACGVCENCLRFLSNNTVDLLTIESEGTLKKELLEPVIPFMIKKPFSGEKSCIYIKKAHLLTTQAQNFLLKSLEEPPDHMVFILSSKDPHKLLSTILSRCSTIRIHALPRAVLSERLSHLSQDPSTLNTILSHSYGSEAQARKLLQDEQFNQKREAAFQIAAMIRNYVNPSIHTIDTILTNAGYDETLFFLITAFRDAAILSLSKNESLVMNQDYLEEISLLSKHFTSCGLSLMIDLLLENYEKKSNCPGLNSRLFTEQMMFHLMEVKNKCLK